METKAKHIFKSSQTCINTIVCSDDFAVPVTNTTTSKNATAEPQQQQQQLKRNMRLSSSSSLGDGSACAMTHQYHYIQYPAYYQLMHDRSAENLAAPQNMLPPTTCRCPCSCGNASSVGIPAASNFNAQHMHQHSDDSQMAVAVIVHQQETGGDGGGNSKNLVTKAKSEQSLLEHSYQALHAGCDDEKPLNLANNTSCDCDLECTCAVALPPKSKQCGGGAISALMLSADEITVSESDNNSTMVKSKSREVLGGNGTKKINTWIAHQDTIMTSAMDRCSRKTNYNSSQIDIYSDGDGDGTDSCLKINNGSNSGDDLRPPLPPRPPPRPRNVLVNINAHRNGAGGIKKYVVWCLICGGFSCLLGVLFLGVYFLLHSYTITVGNFETVPTFVPATLLILTGLCIMSLARRRNRYSYLIKLSGACGLISALTCALVTVTTTVLHMSRLQALRECEYAQKTRTCTCYSDMIESQVERVDKEGVRLVFDSLSDCGVVHGSLYSCLRAIFGLSVAGVLIAVFSCMLVYQLLSHERKKMYWEQLELRCRSLYTSQQGPPPPSMAALTGGRANVCRCCEQCHAHRQVPLQPSAYPWDDGAEPRFWTGQPPGNFYSPNPGGDDLHNTSGGMQAGTCRGHGLSNSRSRATGWSWPRMPWQRSSPVSSNRFRQTPSSPDSQYGFSNNAQAPSNSGEAVLSEEQVFNGVSGTSLPYGVWGPPPPYSDPNSPARRGYYQYLHHPNVTCVNVQPDRQTAVTGAEQHIPRTDCRSAHRTTFGLESQPNDSSVFCAQTTSMRSLSKRNAGIAFKATSSKGDYENTPSDSDGGARDHFSNTLPTRKIKKRVEAGAKSIGPNSQSTQRVNVQHVFSRALCDNEGNIASDLHAYHEPIATQNDNFTATGCIAPRSCAAQSQVATQRHKTGVENTAFQSSAECSTNIVDGRTHMHMHEICDPTESEVYFADVSSCCNISVKNDNYYDDANQAQAGLGQASMHCQNHHASNHNHHQHSTNNSDEDYLAHRFGKRENSIRSRLPFPQTCNDDYDRNSNISAANTNSNNIQKEISRQSMCSVESDTKTEFTDLSPSTPCSNSFTAPHGESSQIIDTATTTTATRMGTATTFVASFPYSSESQSLEAHRRSTRNISNDPQLMVSTEAQYEVINDAASCKPLNFPVVSNGRPVKGGQLQQRPTMLRTVGAANTKKSNRKDSAQEKGQTTYQSDVEWSDGSSCTNDRQNL